ncbi:MAG: DUF4910 domain-containing protein [Pseudomonadota bacterium]
MKLDVEGSEIYRLAEEIYPICRSITGAGVRETLSILGNYIPLEIKEVATGTSVFDWTVPHEWVIRQAYIAQSDGKRVVDFRDHSLHVLNYSAPVRQRMGLADLKPHLFSLPEQPDVIPYRTSYYEKNWGFCLSHNQLEALPDDTYDVVIDSDFISGSLAWGEYLHKGESSDEVLLSAHICHPSLANDNCSGLALLTRLAANLAGRRTRYSYRFLFAPGTIGAITWLAMNEERTDRICNGLVLSCVGDGGGPTYKQSRRGDAMVDRAMRHIIMHAGLAGTVVPFSPYGYDERQYCSPGFNLPVGLFQRSAFGSFPEYHTSADNMDFIDPAHLATSYGLVQEWMNILECDRVMINLYPKGEPQLGRRGLYASIGGEQMTPMHRMAMLWVLNLSDGEHTLLDIADRAELPFRVIQDAATRLEAAEVVCDARR